ncbi:MAG: SIR2 family NAD-dependent protein deacylase [Desulforhopalus sp.]
MNEFERFISVLKTKNRIVGFTGAGISTESGIPDYRSQGGIWEKFEPVYIDEFLNDAKKRHLYWERKQILWQGISRAKVNRTHSFFKELFDTGKLLGLITQNIDGLHEKSGLPSEAIVNLHGTSLEIICLQCGDITPADKIFDDLDLDRGTPLCQHCGGLLKPNTISFGQNLVKADLQRAETMAMACDMVIVAGSTLVVQPAASFPLIAKNNGAVLAIITGSDTPLDKDADFVFHQKLGDFMAKISL